MLLLAKRWLVLLGQRSLNRRRPVAGLFQWVFVLSLNRRRRRQRVVSLRRLLRLRGLQGLQVTLTCHMLLRKQGGGAHYILDAEVAAAH